MLDRFGITDGVGAAADSDTTFIPRLVPVVAGMNMVRLPSGPGIEILDGWFDEHDMVVSCVPVE